MKDYKFIYFYSFGHGKDTKVVPHLHSYYELVFFNQGTGISKCGGETLEYAKHTVILYPPGAVHDERHAEYTNVDCICFQTDEFTLPLIVHNDVSESLFKLKDRIKHELKEKLFDYDKMVYALIYQIMVTLSRQKDLIGAPDNFDLTNIINFIDENLSFNIDIQNLTDLSGYSYDYFRHKFKETIGLSPKQYILNKRIELAKKLLLTTDLNVSAVATNSGFDSISQFSFIFKRYTQKTPLAFRKENANNKEILTERKKSLAKCKAVLFSLDGTLYDNDTHQRKVYEKIYNLLFKRSGIDFDKGYQTFGKIYDYDFYDREEKYEQFCDWLDYHEKSFWDFITIYDNAYLDSPAAYKNSVKTLLALKEKNYLIGIIANGSENEQMRKIRASHLYEIMDTIVIASTFGVSKPDKSLFDTAAKTLNVSNKECAFVGNEPEIDVHGANEAGMISVWLTNKKSNICNADLMIRNLKSLLEIF